MLIESPNWIVTAGSERLRTTPEVLHTGEGNRWIERLRDPKRQCPLIYVSRDHNGAFRVDPARLARLLAGVAVVVEPDGGNFDHELQWLMPRSLRCWDGAVRVYLPRVGDADDQARHRFFTVERIEELTPSTVEDLVIEALARRSPIIVPGILTSIEDVESRRRETRINELRQAADDVSKLREWVNLLEEENQGLSTRQQLLSDENTSLREQLDKSEVEVEEAQDRASKEQSTAKAERARAIKAEARVRQLEDALKDFRALDGFPQDVTGVTSLAAGLFPDRLVFTERALKSARDAAINDTPSAMNMVWKCLRSMATVLYELHFPPDEAEPEAGTIEQQFAARTPFDLALTESSQTKKDAELMKLRKGTYKGKEIDITPHVKYDVGKKFLRIHYFPHSEERVLVIDHCGDHLDTAGTRRRK